MAGLPVRCSEKSNGVWELSMMEMGPGTDGSRMEALRSSLEEAGYHSGSVVDAHDKNGFFRLVVPDVPDLPPLKAKLVELGYDPK